MSAPTFQSFIDAIPVDVREVMREAIVRARYEIKREAKLLGRRVSSLHMIARDALQHAKDRDRQRAWAKAIPLYQAAQDPLTLEINAVETRLYVLRDKVLGKTGYARRHCQDEANTLTARLCELRQPVQMLEAAE